MTKYPLIITMGKIIITSLILLGILFGATAQDSPKRELRAAWIATVEHIDWPAKPGMTTQELQES